MSSRDDILNSVRRHLPMSAPLPDLNGSWIEYDDLSGQFQSMLESVGGVCHTVTSHEEIAEHLKDLAADESLIVSRVPGVFPQQSDLSKFHDPHQLENITLAVMPGQLAVAENAAVWVETSDVLERTLFFLSQHLALVIPASKIVSNLHQAYQMIDPQGTPFGTFLSGPSKTADIEQALVKGAHGARTLQVFLVQESTESDD